MSLNITLKEGVAVGYQGRKKRKTTNAIYLTDRNGLPLVISMPVCQDHNDLFTIEKHFKQITDLNVSAISLHGHPKH